MYWTQIHTHSQSAWYLLQPCVTLMPMVTCPSENLATATGSVRVDTHGCSAAPPCWCLTADRWGVLFHPPRTAKFQRHSHPSQMNWSKMGNRTSQTQPRDPTCLLEPCQFPSGTGPGTSLDFSDLECVTLPAVCSGMSAQCIKIKSKMSKES